MADDPDIELAGAQAIKPDFRKEGSRDERKVPFGVIVLESGVTYGEEDAVKNLAVADWVLTPYYEPDQRGKVREDVDVDKTFVASASLRNWVSTSKEINRKLVEMGLTQGEINRRVTALKDEVEKKGLLVLKDEEEPPTGLEIPAH